MVINKINDKKYIGQTKCLDVNTRWNRHKKCDKKSIGRSLLNAYKKYGIENFKFTIICICFDNDCDKYESEYIKKYNTLVPNGYNLKGGGNTSATHEDTRRIMSEKTKAMMTSEYKLYLSNKLKSSYHPNRGSRLSEDMKKRISNSQQARWASYTNEEKQRIINERMKKRNENKQKDRINTPRKRCSDYLNPNSKRVAQCNNNGDIIKVYESISHASTDHKLAHSTISRVCRNYKSYKSAGGYIWKFI